MKVNACSPALNDQMIGVRFIRNIYRLTMLSMKRGHNMDMTMSQSKGCENFD